MKSEAFRFNEHPCAVGWNIRKRRNARRVGDNGHLLNWPIAAVPETDRGSRNCLLIFVFRCDLQLKRSLRSNRMPDDVGNHRGYRLEASFLLILIRIDGHRAEIKFLLTIVHWERE